MEEMETSSGGTLTNSKARSRKAKTAHTRKSTRHHYPRTLIERDHPHSSEHHAQPQLGHEDLTHNQSGEHDRAEPHHTHDSEHDVTTDDDGRLHLGGARATMKRLNLNLTERLYSAIEQMAREQGTSMTEMIRVALGLVHLASVERKKGGQLAIIDVDGSLHKIVLPY